MNKTTISSNINSQCLEINFATLPETQWQEAKRRYAVLKSLIDQGSASHNLASEAAQKLSLSLENTKNLVAYYLL